MGSAVRQPAVAGTFYPADENELMGEVRGYIEKARQDAPDVPGAMNAMAVIAPHAGYFYSGHVAGAVFSSVNVTDTVIIVGPNHRGLGAPGAVDDSTAWSFPFGDVKVDAQLSEMLVSGCEQLEYDSAAHAIEHSLEVMAPFLFARNKKVSIAAICIGTHNEKALECIGKSVALAQEKTGALVVASTDMTHYVPDEVARERDRASIELIEKMDEKALLEKVKRDNSLCGAGAVAVVLAAARENGCKRAKLVRYATSGDISGEKDSVVGYAGFTIDGG